MQKIKQLKPRICWSIKTYTGSKDHPCKTYPFKWEEFRQEQQKIKKELKSKISKGEVTWDDSLLETIYNIESSLTVPEALCTGDSTVNTLVQQLPRLGPFSEHHLQVLRDEQLDFEQRIDRILAQHYKNLLASGKTSKEAYDICTGDRIIYFDELTPRQRNMIHITKKHRNRRRGPSS